MDSFADLRRMMVDCQLRTYDVTDRAVLAAADSVPREAFLPAALAHKAYLDQSVTLPGTTRALMTPMVLARMILNLAIQPGDKALEYGGGSGYGAALMAHMGANATLWETDPQARALAEAVPDRAFAVVDAEPAPGSFDAVLVSGSCASAPESLFALLADGGRLVVAEGTGRSGRIKLYQKSGPIVAGRPIFDAAIPELPEFRPSPAFVF